MDLYEKMIESDEIYNGKIFKVLKDTVRLANDKTSTREIIRHNGAVCIVPLTENSEVIIEKQFRYAINQITLEIPAGKLEVGEDTLECAKRELEEETGYIAENIELMGEYYASPAILDEKITMYLATGLKKSGRVKLDEDEFLEVLSLPIDKLVSMIMSGEIKDAKTQCGILRVWNKINI